MINPDEEIPAYIHIKELEFQGIQTNSHNISEVWVFDQGTMLGAYDLPADIPVLEEGPNELTFRAGIKNNGVSTNRIMYPFYTTYKETLNQEKFKTDTVVPYFEIKDEVVIPLEFATTFEVGANYEETSSSLAEMDIIDNEESFEEEAGYIELDSDHPIWQANSTFSLDLPTGEFVFLELNYKCNNSFAVGLTANQGSGSNNIISVIINPSEDDNGVPQWNKIYIDLGAPISAYPNAEDYNILFESNLDGGNGLGQIYLDNIKVIHFE